MAEDTSDDDMFEDEDEFRFDDSRKEKRSLSEEEIYGFGDSDEFEEDEGEKSEGDDGEDDLDMGSDINDEDEDRSDDRAWGKKNRRFYNTDYVDQDYEGFYEGKEAEEAELEEQEAKQIQKRLIQELDEADFDIAPLITTQPAPEKEDFEEIERDLSSMTTRQKIDLLKKESPEFFVLVEDLKEKLNEIRGTLLPALDYFEKSQKVTLCVDFLKKKLFLLTNYCTNISFYFLLKAKRIPVQNHPVLKSLYKHRKLLQQIQEIDEMIKPQIEKILQEIKTGNEPTVSDKSIFRSKKNRKNILKLLMKDKQEGATREDGEDGEDGEELNDGKELDSKPDDDVSDHSGEEDNEGFNDGEASENEINQSEKRAITYEMAKNKGLMPKRNKDQRNPRVKHRKKYRKALIRRRGQVRTARSEIPVYGGEPTGIKVGVTKSIKFK